MIKKNRLVNYAESDIFYNYHRAKHIVDDNKY